MLMRFLRCVGWMVLVNMLVAVSGAADAAAVISGELKQWHKITLSFAGPQVGETDATNPFLDYRLDVSFTHAASGRTLVVPGYFAADGNAANTGAKSGRVWRAHFAPDATGAWTYKASFRTGAEVAIADAMGAGAPTSFDGASGGFTVGATDKAGADFRGKGRLQEVGQHYLRHLGSGEYFVKAGAGSPENFLAYADFDNTAAGRKPLHRYTTHLAHYRADDPTWKNGKGKAIVGALNYLASKKMNSLYFLTMNVGGDGDDVFPWTAKSERYRYDVSKLAQWEIVFEHMDELGIHLHMVTQEQENDQLLDRGSLGVQRKLYYRELVARFSHHLGLTWNLGEESTNTTAQRESFADYINAIDPYLHLIAVHTFPQDHDKVYTPILGHDVIGAASLQLHSPSLAHTETLKWVNKSAATGRKWVVAVDEIGSASVGVKPDANDAGHRVIAHRVLWGSLLAGAAGVEWYFGYDYAHDDLTCEDWTTRENMWTLTNHAAQFVRDYLPLPLVGNYNAITSTTSDYCFGKPGVAYAIYLPAGATTSITLPAGETYTVQWFDPRHGGGLRSGTIATVSGGGAAAIGRPPADTSLDWVALLRRSVADGGTAEPEKPEPTLAIAELMLVDAKTQRDVRPLTDGATIDLSADGAVLNVRASVNGEAGSVAFYLNGRKTLENTAPWAMAGDLNGVFQPWKPAVGRHTLRVVPYPRSNGGGEAGETQEISFTVVAVAPPTTEPPAPEPENPTPILALTEFVLVDAANHRDLRVLEDGAVIKLSEDGRALNIRAETTGAAQSVWFSWDGAGKTENTAPFAFAGDNDGVYLRWKPARGTHTLRAVPYSKIKRGGVAGLEKRISITVVD